MTIINPKSIAGVTSITTPSGSDNLFTVHTNNTTERIRINNDGDVIVGSGITVSPDGDIFATGVTTATTFVGALTGNVTGNISGGTVAGSTGTFTGDVDIADKIAHTGDTDTAIRFPSANTISFEANGSERVRINADGKFGIGTNDPQRTLHLSSNNTVLALTDTAASTDQKTKYILSDAGAFAFGKLSDDYGTATEQFRIGNSGNIGVGENSPAAALDVKGSGVPIIVNSSNSNTYKIQFENAGSTLGYIGAVTDAIVFSNSSAAEQARFTDAGLKLPSGRGIDFSATGDSSGTMSSELLDDYEEGTFTPSIILGATSISYSIQRGSYTKIGDIVEFQIDLYMSGTADGNYIRIGGLPFTSANQATYAFGGAFLNYSQGAFGEIGDRTVFHLISQNTYMQIYNAVTGNVVSGTSTGVALFNNKEICLTGIYKAA